MPAASLATNRHEADSGTPTARAEAGFDLAVPADAGLAARLKQATAPAHRVAESSGIIRRFIERRASRDDYLLYLRNLHPIYTALEARLARLQNAPGFDPIADPALARRDAIESDLAALAGDDWRRQVALLPRAEAYARRIDETSDAGLAAHAYVRYLGDLNGGFVIKRLLQKSMGLGEDQLRFYDFPAIGDIEQMCRRFRSALDQLGETLGADAIVDEALLAFELATQLSLEIESAAGSDAAAASVVEV